MSDTVIKCGPRSIEPPFGVTAFVFLSVIYSISSIVGATVACWLKMSYRLDYARVIFKSYQKDGWAGLRKFLKENSFRQFRESWKETMRRDEQQRRAEEASGLNNTELSTDNDGWTEILFIFGLVLVVSSLLFTFLFAFVEAATIVSSTCAPWAVVFSTSSLGMLFSFVFYLIIMGVTPQLHCTAVVVPVDNESYGMVRIPAQPSAQQHATESLPPNTPARAAAYVVQPAQEPAVGQSMGTRPRNTPSVGQQDQEPPAEERPRLQTEGSNSSSGTSNE